MISTKHPRSASADTLGSRLCQDCLATVASRLETTENGEFCLHRDRLLIRPANRSIHSFGRSTCALACIADVLGRLRSEEQRMQKGFSLCKQRLARKACKKLVEEHSGVFALLCMQHDGTVSYTLPDRMEEEYPAQAAQLTTAWDSFAAKRTALQQRQEQQAGHQVSAAPSRVARSGAPVLAPDGSAFGGFPAVSVQDVEPAAFQYSQPLQASSEPVVNMPQLPGRLPPPTLVPEPLDPEPGPAPATVAALPRQQAVRRAQGRSEVANGAELQPVGTPAAALALASMQGQPASESAHYRLAPAAGGCTGQHPVAQTARTQQGVGAANECVCIETELLSTIDMQGT